MPRIVAPSAECSYKMKSPLTRSDLKFFTPVLPSPTCSSDVYGKVIYFDKSRLLVKLWAELRLNQ